MKTIDTAALSPLDLDLMSEDEKLWVYNGLDCCVTSEVYQAIAPQLDPVTRKTYQFSLALQAPVLEMKLRGVLIDQERRNDHSERKKSSQAKPSNSHATAIAIERDASFHDAIIPCAERHVLNRGQGCRPCVW